MAAHEASAGSDGGARRPPQRAPLSLPPRAPIESFFASSAAAGSSAGTSPGPLTLAAVFFPDMPSPVFHGSFTQLLAGAMGSPPAPSAAAPSPPSPFTVPPGLSPTALLGSPSFFSSTGNFEMSHQQALAQVTAQAVHSQYIMDSQADYSLPFSSTTSALTSQRVNSSAHVTSTKETATLPSHTGNDNLKSNEVSQGFETSALAVDKPADDGYNWRKYGQKAVKGGEYPRSYYKCTQASCPVKKKVERSACGAITQIIYRGQHNHQRPPKRRSKDGSNLLNGDDFHENGDTLTRSELGSQDHSGKVEVSNDSKRGDRGDQSSGSSDSEEENNDEAGAENGDAGVVNANKSGLCSEQNFHSKIFSTSTYKMLVSCNRHVPAPAQRIIVQTTSAVDLLDDGYRWRKYGQKVVKGNPHPRSYYKCTYHGCDVKKHIERCSQEPTAVITTYEGKHSHDLPAARNSSHASAASANASSSSSLRHRGQNTASSNQWSSRREALHTSPSDSSLQLKEENEVT